jgi:hypothetical protein
VGIFKYIVQGVGWEIGSQAARRGIESLEQQQAEQQAEQQARDQQPPSKRELRAAAKQAARDRKEREAAIKRNQARIEDELRALKKKADR